MTLYFGHNSVETTQNTGNSTYMLWQSYAAEAVCQGTGAQQITDLSAYLSIASGSSTFKLAIYTWAGALVCHSTNAITVDSATPSWVGVDGSGITWDSGTSLTGGSSYKICIRPEVNGIVFYEGTGTGADGSYNDGWTYANAWEATLPVPGTESQLYCFRCGTDDLLPPTTGVGSDTISVVETILSRTNPIETFDACTTYVQPSLAASFSFIHTTANNLRRLLLVSVHNSRTDISTVTCDSVSMTKATSSQQGAVIVELYYIVNQAVGTNTVQVTWNSGNGLGVVIASSYSNIRESNPIVTTGYGWSTTTTLNAGITSSTGELIYSAISVGDAVSYSLSPAVGQTKRGSVDGTTLSGGVSERLGGPTSTLMVWSWTGNNNAAASVVSLNPYLPAEVRQYQLNDQIPTSDATSGQFVHLMSVSDSALPTETLNALVKSYILEYSELTDLSLPIDSFNANLISTNAFFVATNGNDGNSGSISSPRLTLDGGIALLSSGSTLYVRAGTYANFADNANIPSGTSWDNATTISAYPGETVNITGGGPCISNYGAKFYIVINGFDIDCDGGGLWIGNGSGYIKISNNVITNCGNHGIVESPSASGYNWITGNVLHYGGYDPTFDPPFPTHDNNLLYNNCIYTTRGNNLIEHNEIYNWSGCSIQVYYSGQYNMTSNTVIRYNLIHDTSGSYGTLGSGDNAGQGIAIGNGDNIQIYGNIIYNLEGVLDGPNHTNSDGAIMVVNSCSDTKIYNNTIYNNSSHSITQIFPDIYDSIIRNNIIYNNLEDAINDGGSGTVLSNNLIGDPTFVNAAFNNFHLQASSAAIDAGYTLSSPYNVDYDGRTQTAPFDIGAYEYYVSGTQINADPITDTEALSELVSMAKRGLGVIGDNLEL